MKATPRIPAQHLLKMTFVRSLLQLLLLISLPLASVSQIDVDVSVPPYSAVGDGKSDQTAALQQAFDAAAQAGGGRVYIPSGVYLVTNSLVIGSNTSVTGAGRQATIIRGVYTPAYPGRIVNGAEVYATLAMVAASNSAVTHLTVDNYSSAFTANGIVSLPDGLDYSGIKCSNCTVEDCEVLATDYHQYLIWNLKGTHIKILHNFCQGNVPTPDPNSGQEGIESFGGDDVLIEGNTILNIGRACINLGPALGLNDAQTANVLVQNNFCQHSAIGVHTGAVNDPTFGSQSLEHIHIKNNVLLDCSLYGIDCQTQFAGTQVNDLQIAGNTISNAPVAIYVYGDPGLDMQGVNVTDNTIEHITTTQQGAICIYYSSNMTASRNLLRDCAYEGMRVQFSTNVSILDNQLSRLQMNALNALACDDLRVIGNRFLEYNGANSYNPGVILSASTRSIVSDNDFDVRNESYAAICDMNSDRIIMKGNRVLYAATFNPVFVNLGSNGNYIRFTASPGIMSMNVQNSLVFPGCRLWLTQVAGTPIPFTHSYNYLSFDMAFATETRGDEVFECEIGD